MAQDLASKIHKPYQEDALRSGVHLTTGETLAYTGDNRFKLFSEGEKPVVFEATEVGSVPRVVGETDTILVSDTPAAKQLLQFSLNYEKLHRGTIEQALDSTEVHQRVADNLGARLDTMTELEQSAPTSAVAFRKALQNTHERLAAEQEVINKRKIG